MLPGQSLGTIGNTGNSEGAHVHYEVASSPDVPLSGAANYQPEIRADNGEIIQKKIDGIIDPMTVLPPNIDELRSDQR